WLLPIHVVDFAGWAQVLYWISMAVETPLHLQGVLLVHDGHLIHLPMTALAADAFIYVNFVMEVDEVWKIVHLGPYDGLARSPAMANRLQNVGVGPYLRVAVHAGAGGGNAGIARFFDRGMTVLALEAESFNMMFVAEWNRLIGTLSLAGYPRGSLKFIERDSQGDNDQSR